MAENISGLLSRIKEKFTVAQSAGSSESYSNMAGVFTQAERDLRESFQRMTRDQVSQIIIKLNSGTILTSSEMDMVKLWIVGDAESYVRHENNFNDWVVEIRRLIGEIAEAERSASDIKTIMRLRALILDAKRTTMDIAHFLEKKECVARFEESTVELDQEERVTLVKMLKFSMSSDLS